ncbi:MAG: LysR family transcriptional regulator [Bacteroidales bacterium]|nr:LysR family transcriptional regulator [Bacteroidales bacterium]
MDFRLKVFTVVAKCLSFTKASKELAISQPAVTKHIQELESIYNIRLFERAGGKISLTYEGHRFLKHANEILCSYNLLADEMHLMATHSAGLLRIGTHHTVAQYLMPALLAGYMRLMPNLRLELFTGDTAQIEEALKSKSIDLGIVESSETDMNFQSSPLIREVFVLVTNSLTPSPESIPADELFALPMVSVKNGSDMLSEMALKARGFTAGSADFNTLVQLESIDGVKRFLESMEGSYALLPSISVTDGLESGRLKVVAVEETLFERELVLVSNRGERNVNVNNFASFALRFLENRYPDSSL